MRMLKPITSLIVKSTLLGEVIASIDFDDKFFFSAIEVSRVDAANGTSCCTDGDCEAVARATLRKCTDTDASDERIVPGP